MEDADYDNLVDGKKYKEKEVNRCICQSGGHTGTQLCSVLLMDPPHTEQ